MKLKSNMQIPKRIKNKSPPAPIEGVYRYELIPAETPMEYYIDLWFQYGIGLDDKDILNKYNDAVYLNKGDIVSVNDNGIVSVVKKQSKLKLVVNNG